MLTDHIESFSHNGINFRDKCGDTAGKYIRNYLVQLAKNGLASGKTISEVAYDIGLEYPQHLSRMFKKQTGMTPKEYVMQVKNKL